MFPILSSPPPALNAQAIISKKLSAPSKAKATQKVSTPEVQAEDSTDGGDEADEEPGECDVLVGGPP